MRAVGTSGECGGSRLAQGATRCFYLVSARMRWYLVVGALTYGYFLLTRNWH